MKWWMLILVLAFGCGDDEEAGASTEAETETETETGAEPEAEAAVDSDEACAQVLVVAHAGAQYASDDITRTEETGRSLAEDYLARIEEGEDFAVMAREHSDASSSGPRGGLMGTYAREDWPAAHDAIETAVFGLSVGQVSQVLTAPYGHVIARRCAVEKIHTRHILIRYRGARNAPDSITRDEDAARNVAEVIRETLMDDPNLFDAQAREHSEDGSAERGGDLGEVGRGLLAPEYEEAAWQLEGAAISLPIRTDFGFHLIQRVL